MADAKLRELERRARTGDPQAEAEQLLARVRAGTLSRERLELAAWLAHPAAAQVSSSTVRARFDLQFLHELGGRSAEVVRCALLAAGGVALQALIEQGSAYDEPTRPCAGCYDETLGCDCGGSGWLPWPEPEAILSIARHLFLERSPEDEQRYLDAWLACERAWLEVPERIRPPLHWLPSPPDTPNRESLWDRGALHHASRLGGEGKVRDAIRKALLRWALGGSP